VTDGIVFFFSRAVKVFDVSNDISWDDQRIFLAVLEAGSFSAAARRLAVTHPTVRSRIEALEKALGAVLFVRSTSGLVATDLAEALRQPAKAMADASLSFHREAASSEGAAGIVRMSVPEIMGTEVMPKMLAGLRTKYPDLKIELVLNDAIADLLTREVDLAIRTVTPTQNTLVARKVATIPLGLFASSAYVERRGIPAALSDLREHDLIGPDQSRTDWSVAASLGLTSGSNSFVMKTDSHSAQIAAIRQGVGIGVVQTTLADDDSDLIRILPDAQIQPLSVWVVTHESLLKMTRIRVSFDHFVREFQQLRRRPAATARPAIVVDPTVEEVSLAI
jgi:DNA-binding transcriptional LysR family regulator